MVVDAEEGGKKDRRKEGVEKRKGGEIGGEREEGIEVRQKHIMCLDLKKDTLYCTDDGSVLEIHKSYIGQDVQELFKCVGYDVSDFQNPCADDRDMTKKTKVKCDGRRSCNINDSLLVDECSRLVRSFNVEFSCQANRTEGRITFIF
ncbi:Hypothetical predicted protein [Paramuricea clavata]|uniref:Uncharacterized protein n=1 Tax=Paramuricea clavata TaxID=317549 RepID=A0A6S7IIQ6_PARCT|nr:Hypothetical predicted protein [Paramuricea clavata]